MAKRMTRKQREIASKSTKRRKSKKPSKAAIAAVGVLGLYVVGSAVGDTEAPAPAAASTHLSELGQKCLEPARALKKAHFPDLVQGIAMAAAESGCDNDAVNYNKDGSVDRCFMQDNSVHGKNVDTLDRCAKVATGVYKSQGVGAWSSHNNGSDREFLPMAREVAELVR